MNKDSLSDEILTLARSHHSLRQVSVRLIEAVDHNKELEDFVKVLLDLWKSQVSKQLDIEEQLLPAFINDQNLSTAFIRNHCEVRRTIQNLEDSSFSRRLVATDIRSAADSIVTFADWKINTLLPHISESNSSDQLLFLKSISADFLIDGS